MTQHTESVQEVAVASLAKANNSIVKATELMVARVNKSDRLFRALMQPLLKAAVYDALRAVCRKERGEIWRAPILAAAGTRASVAALATGTANALMNFPLPGGTRLGDATPAEVIEAADFYRTQANAMAVRGRWLDLIARVVPNGKKVSDVLTEERLAQLQAEAAR